MKGCNVLLVTLEIDNISLFEDLLRGGISQPVKTPFYSKNRIDSIYVITIRESIP